MAAICWYFARAFWSLADTFLEKNENLLNLLLFFHFSYRTLRPRQFMTTLRRQLMSWHFARGKFWMSLNRTQMGWMDGGYAHYAAAKEFVPETDSNSSTSKLVAIHQHLRSRHPALHLWACPHLRLHFLVKCRNQASSMRTRRINPSRENDDRGI